MSTGVVARVDKAITAAILAVVVAVGLHLLLLGSVMVIPVVGTATMQEAVVLPFTTQELNPVLAIAVLAVPALLDLARLVKTKAATTATAVPVVQDWMAQAVKVLQPIPTQTTPLLRNALVMGRDLPSGRPT